MTAVQFQTNHTLAFFRGWYMSCCHITQPKKRTYFISISFSRCSKSVVKQIPKMAHLPCGSQTWLAGKSLINGGFNGTICWKIIELNGRFSSNPCLMTPDGKSPLLLVYIIWVNYNELTTTSLEIIVSKGKYPQIALIQVSELL